MFDARRLSSAIRGRWHRRIHGCPRRVSSSLSCEPCSLIPAGYLPYPLQRISQIRGPNVGALPWLSLRAFPLRARLGLSIFTPCPALSPGPDLPQRISLGQPPSLHLLRGVRYSPVFVRRLLGYYGPVRLPAPVRRCHAPCGFTARTPTPLRAKCGTSRLPCRSLPCVRRVSDHAGAEQLLR